MEVLIILTNITDTCVGLLYTGVADMSVVWGRIVFGEEGEVFYSKFYL